MLNRKKWSGVEPNSHQIISHSRIHKTSELSVSPKCETPPHAHTQFVTWIDSNVRLPGYELTRQVQIFRRLAALAQGTHTEWIDCRLPLSKRLLLPLPLFDVVDHKGS